MSNKRRFFGSLDAARDERFEDHFVESLDLRRLQTNSSDVIYGAKGVGKTALRRALCELYGSKYHTTTTIDLDPISFSQVHVALSHLQDTVNTETVALASNTWRNVMAMHCLETVAGGLPVGDPLRRQINDLLAIEGFSGRNSNNRLIRQIEQIMIRIAEIGTDSGPTPLGVTERQREAATGFPFNAQVRSLLAGCASLVERTGKFVLICVDGFDSIVDHTKESRRVIFAGLIDAIFKCAADPIMARAFCFKAFLPQELTDDAMVTLWDDDKNIYNTRYLRWSAEDFQQLLCRRMRPYSRTKSGDFNDVWHEYMPERIRNVAYGTDESSFAYILRHTLYRPRQLLTHVQNIIDEWDERSTSFRIDPSFIPRVVAETNVRLARHVVSQLEIKHPGLRTFMQSWSGAPNVMGVREFQDKMRRVFGINDAVQLNDMFNDLFNGGIFGVKRQASSGQRHFRFGFAAGHIAEMHAAVEENDLVALSPMFHEYCGCVTSERGPILPEIAAAS